MHLGEVRKLHQEGLRPCRVAESAAACLDVRCVSCGGPMQAELLSACRGVARMLLFFRCPRDGRIGQVRFTRSVDKARCVDAMPPSRAIVLEGQQGYQHARCDCGSVSTIALVNVDFGDGAEALMLRCVLGCGHAFQLQTPCARSFTMKEHRHG